MSKNCPRVTSKASISAGNVLALNRVPLENSLDSRRRTHSCNCCLSLGRASVATVWFATCVGVLRRGYCKRIVVKPARRKGYLPCNVKVSTVKRGPATGRADRGANSGVGREGASLDPGKRTHTPELRTTAPGPGSPMSATCKGTRGFMAKRKAVVPNTLGDDILDRLRTCTNRPQQVKAA